MRSEFSVLYFLDKINMQHSGVEHSVLSRYYKYVHCRRQAASVRHMLT